MYKILRFLILVGFCASFANAEPRPMTTVDLVELATISSPSLSADGKHLVYSRSEINWEENKEVYRYRLVNLETGDVAEGFEPEKPKESFGSAIWAGTEGLITLLEREGDDHRQAYFYDPLNGELTRLTDHRSSIKGVVWAPDNSGFYFRARVPLSDQEDRDFEDDWLIREYETSRFHELWFFNWETKETSKLLGGDFDVRSYGVSRDSKKIIYARTDHSLGDAPDRELWLYDLETQSHKVLTNNSYAERNASLSPNLNQFAFIAAVNADGEQYYEKNVFIQSVDSFEPVAVLSEVPMEMNGFAWSKDGSALFILGNTGVREHLYRYSLESKELVALTSGDSVVSSWRYSVSSDAHTFTLASADNPGEVWILDGQSRGELKPKLISDEYADLSEKFILPKQVVFTWQGRRSQELEGILVYPLNYEEGKPFPLVTQTHGGPRLSFKFGTWRYSRNIAVFAAQGYGVFLTNHRGGTGYGDKFLRDMVGNYFRHSHLDIMDGIDALIDAGIADPDQLIKMGWSAGGHMTNKLITFTDRFKAASSGAGAADWVSMYAESDLRYNRTPWFGSSPWEKNANHRNFHRQSPLKDAWRVTTPTLFFVGENDVRVPPTQSIMMYRGVKAAGAETELYIAPGQPHGFTKPSYRLFKINKELEWFAHHLGRDAYMPVYPAAKYEHLIDQEN